MKPVTISGLTGAVIASLLLSSCTTTGDNAQKASITQRPDSYHGKGSGVTFGNDIKTILSAGGLDTQNPSSPSADTKRLELAKASGKTEIDQLVASLQASGSSGMTPPPPQVAEVPDQQRLAAKPVEVAVLEQKVTSAKKQPSAVTAMVEEEGTVTEESYSFPPIGPNLKPGQTINLEPTVPVIPANVSGQLTDPAIIKQHPVPSKKVSRPNPKPEIVYAEPAIKRF